MKTKKELRNIAKQTLVKALAKAYYDVSDHADDFSLTEDEVIEVIEFMDSYGKTMCKAIREKYYTV